ncbi:IS1096 element passenger TnpR family protein [Desulfonatronum thioautotrophicum]|uniref:IS1096 element passenger TnpR family protein n=1 Tax=Desulfonatronum thioautotrophicum TaxID=617001 RepID=UPI0005EB8333|nr:hypothetical protein [Desulfonatronum thioautotrophicum]
MSIVYTLSIECVFGAHLEKPFFRVVEVPFDMTLDDLQDYIHELTDFDYDHLSDFYISSSPNGEKKWFEHIGGYFGIPLNELYPLPKHKKLYYLFDFGDNWTFEIRRKSSGKKAIPDVEYPRIIKSEGPIPEQYPSFEDD